MTECSHERPEMAPITYYSMYYTMTLSVECLYPQ